MMELLAYVRKEAIGMRPSASAVKLDRTARQVLQNVKAALLESTVTLAQSHVSIALLVRCALEARQRSNARKGTTAQPSHQAAPHVYLVHSVWLVQVPAKPVLRVPSAV